MWLNLLEEIFDVCVVPLLGVLTTFLVAWLKQSMSKARSAADNEKAEQYLIMLENTIVTCVQATNQTYVAALKDKNAFDAEAQKEALKMTYDAVVGIVTDDAKEYIGTFVNDFELFVKEKIEQAVNNYK